MKKYLVCCLFLVAFMLVLPVMPVFFVSDDSSSTAYALGHRGDRGHISGGDRHHGGGSNDQGSGGNPANGGDTGKPGYQVPEPTTLALMGTGIAGIGIFYFIRRKNRK